jgi:hypothetical protein
MLHLQQIGCDSIHFASPHDVVAQIIAAVEVDLCESSVRPTLVCHH